MRLERLLAKVVRITDAGEDDPERVVIKTYKNVGLVFLEDVGRFVIIDGDQALIFPMRRFLDAVREGEAKDQLLENIELHGVIVKDAPKDVDVESAIKKARAVEVA